MSLKNIEYFIESDTSASAQTIYCPYTDQDIAVGDSSPEHIIPLALGGLNSFTLPVSATFNSKVGSEIDGTLANDFVKCPTGGYYVGLYSVSSL